MIYIVLGCHKSGTTLAAEILHRSGIPMIEGEIGETDYDAGDFFERADWVYLNQDLIGHRDPADDHPAALKVSATDAQRRWMAAEIERVDSAHEDWGFKDPRTCLTYPIWRELLPEHAVVAIHRSLPEVWANQAKQSWRRRSLWKTIRMWVAYNSRLADIVEARLHFGLPTIVLGFEALMREDAELARLERFLGRKVADPRVPGRYRSRGRSQRRIAVLDYLMGQAGYCQPAVVQERLDAFRER